MSVSDGLPARHLLRWRRCSTALLLAGLLALLALGLNLIFGVIDVVWICYAELVMVGMYGIHYAHKGGAPFLLAALFGIAAGGARRRAPALSW